MPSVIQERSIPDLVRALGGMENPDYVDLFTATTDGAADASPEQWTRTAIEEVAGGGGQFIWRGVLGLRLDARPGPARIGGWRIAARGDYWIRLEASSPVLTAHLVSRIGDGRLAVGTFIRYDHPIAPLIWVPLSAIHRYLMPGLLLQTVRRQLGRSTRGSPSAGDAATRHGRPWSR